MTTNAIYVKVPEAEYVKYKMFCAMYKISMQLLVRKALNKFIQDQRNKKEIL